MSDRRAPTHFTMLPREDRAALLFWIGVALALGVAANFCALAAAAN